MPQLETSTYLSQYRMTIFILFLLFTLMVGLVLPTLKYNWLIRNTMASGTHKKVLGDKLTNSQVASNLWGSNSIKN